MASRKEFALKIANETQTHVDRAVAFLYYYRETQEFEERTASELATDLYEEDFPKPNVTTLKAALKNSKFTVKGKRQGSFKIDVRRLSELIGKYSSFLKTRVITVGDSVIPSDWVNGTRTYLERMVYQINGCYKSGFYDACAVLCRRLMESLIIEVYIYLQRHHEIQKNKIFIPLDALIKYIAGDKSIVLGRSTPKSMEMLKQLGDTAAHDRTYVTPQVDIDDQKLKIRKLIQDLLDKANIKAKSN